MEWATAVTISYLDRDGESRTLEASGFEAVAIQHEMDHLDGVLFLDRIVSLKTGLFQRKNTTVRRTLRQLATDKSR